MVSTTKYLTLQPCLYEGAFIAPTRQHQLSYVLNLQIFGLTVLINCFKQLIFTKRLRQILIRTNNTAPCFVK